MQGVPHQSPPTMPEVIQPDKTRMTPSLSTSNAGWTSTSTLMVGTWALITASDNPPEPEKTWRKIRWRPCFAKISRSAARRSRGPVSPDAAVAAGQRKEDGRARSTAGRSSRNVGGSPWTSSARGLVLQAGLSRWRRGRAMHLRGAARRAWATAHSPPPPRHLAGSSGATGRAPWERRGRSSRRSRA